MLFIYPGKLLNISANENMVSLNSTINQLKNDLERAPDTLEDLKFVLKTISNIQDITLDVETRARDIKERLVNLFATRFYVIQE